MIHDGPWVHITICRVTMKTIMPECITGKMREYSRHNQFIVIITTSVSVYASSAVHSAFAVGLLNANIIGLSLISAMALITSEVKSRPAPATPVINQGTKSNFIISKIKQFLLTAFLYTFNITKAHANSHYKDIFCIAEIMPISIWKEKQ